MFDREHFLVDCVTTITSDDYESFEIILDQTRSLAALKGMEISEAEVAKAVERAVTNGLIEAYMLSGHEPYSVKARYSDDRLHELWFYITEAGKKTAKSMPELSGENV